MDHERTTEGHTNNATNRTTEEPCGKRRRCVASSDSSPSIQCSCEEFLSVPLHIIFRQVAQTRTNTKKPLLTRAEASTFLRIMDLAHELDVIVTLVSQALEYKVTSRQIRTCIDGIPTLRSLVPLLAIQGQFIPDTALAYLQGELQRVLSSLENCASVLKQFSEQNWTMSDSLLDAFGGSNVISSAHVLAHEKKLLSDLQEELSKRLDHLTTNEGQVLDDYAKEEDLSIAKWCNRMFNILEEPSLVLPPRTGRDEDEVREATIVEETLVSTREREQENHFHARLGDGVEVDNETTTHTMTSALPSADENEKTSPTDDNHDDPMDKSDVIEDSPRKAETAHILAAMDYEETDTYMLDDDTEPLPDTLANTQTAVATLAGLTSGTPVDR